MGMRMSGTHRPGMRIKITLLRMKFWTSGQDGGLGRYALLPHTTKGRATANLKTKNNQNCQKIELFRSPTTKELKKKHSSGLVGGAEMGSHEGEDVRQGNGLHGQGGGWWIGQSHIHVHIN